MRLRRVEAVRFGRLEGASLGDLGDGLTVVVGPNEAGKSSYTALVRHVLYGFPTPGAKEPRFLSAAGKRQGRLIFEQAEGTWVVERTEGVHGGPVVVNTISGSDRPDLLAEITHGVSVDAYRVVLGFGLSDLAHIEELRGKDDDIVSRLYAAGAGLTVSPQDVRSSIEKAAEELWAARGSTRLANKLYAQMREARARLRELENEATSYAADQERLAALESELAKARGHRDATAVRRRELERDAATLEEREREVDSLGAQLLDVRRSAAALSDTLASLVVDERVLGAAAEIDSVLADLTAHRDRLERISALSASIDELDARIARVVAELGLASDELPHVSPETIPGVEAWRETLSRADLLAVQSERAAAETAADATAAEESAASAATAGPASLRAGVPIAAWAMAAGGAVAGIAGLATSQYVAVVVGVLLFAVGLVLAFIRPGQQGHIPLSADAARLADKALDARERASSAAEMARADAATLAEKRAEWRAWLDVRGLAAAGSEPAGVAAFLAELKDVDALLQDRAGREAEASRERQTASAYAHRLASVTSVFLPEASGISGVQAPGVAERARAMLLEARTLADERARVSERLEIVRERIRELEESQRAAVEAASKIISAHGLENGGLSELKGLEDGARIDAERAVDAYDSLAEAATALKTELGREGRESEMGEVRLELTSLDERRQRAASEHVTLALGAQLLGLAQERYERERQPQVVRTAQAVFERITDGRYTGLTVPLGGSEIKVFGSDASPHSTAELSRGTAEQMYLALRIGLIEQLGDVGSGLPVLMDDILVNFDSERREGAARAIAELAKARQVVFFTCHAETAEVLSTVAPQRTLLELDRCGL